MSHPMTKPRAVATLDTFKRRVDAALAVIGDAIEAAPVSYRKVGGLHFIKVGRVSGSFSVKRAAPTPSPVNEPSDADKAALASRIASFVK